MGSSPSTGTRPTSALRLGPPGPVDSSGSAASSNPSDPGGLRPSPLCCALSLYDHVTPVCCQGPNLFTFSVGPGDRKPASGRFSQSEVLLARMHRQIADGAVHLSPDLQTGFGPEQEPGPNGIAIAATRRISDEPDLEPVSLYSCQVVTVQNSRPVVVVYDNVEITVTLYIQVGGAA